MNQTQPTIEPSEAQAQHEANLWAAFADTQPTAREAFCQSWLALQSHMLTEVLCGMVLLKEPEQEAYIPAAVWPSPEQNITHLKPAAERSLAERRGLLESSQGDDASGIQIAYPIEVQGQLYGVVVLELAKRSKVRLQDAFRKLHWGIAWIELVVRRSPSSALGIAAQASQSRGPAQERLELMIEMVAAVVEEPRYKAAVRALATELALVLECDRASIGLVKGKKIKLQAISHSVQFGKNMNLVRAIELAMEEALDQQAPVRFPDQQEGIPLVTQAHEALIKDHGGEFLCSVPFSSGGEFVGVLTLERSEGQAFDDDRVKLAEGVTELVGPVIITKRRDDKWLIAKVFDSAKEQLKRLFGPRHLTYKLVAILLAAIGTFCVVAEGDYRVAADALLEGEVQRVVAAPQEGFVATAEVRAGDLVEAGQVMAQLDDRDLELERLKLASERDQYQKEYREALASADRAKVSILSAQNQQVQAQLALVMEQLSRLKLLAPFDGVVVSGDLTQSLGAPVERGEELFVVAPLESYRVVIKIDERQIGHVEVGQSGQLALTSMPNEPIELVVEKITPVATTEEGRNYFRVEGSLSQDSDGLRPGMQGVAKVHVDQRKLVWIWARELINWVQLTYWKFVP